jgi:dipeptidase E
MAKDRNQRHIVALGGGGFLMEPRNPLLDDFVLRLSGKKHPRVCFIGTASGDNEKYIARTFYRAFAPPRARPSHLNLFKREVRDIEKFLLSQDVIYVGGGNTANMLAIWRLHRVDKGLRAAWRNGVVLAGISAGAICWFEDGITDSFGMPKRALGDGLGFLPDACCPHYDGEKDRRPVALDLVRRGFPPILALDNGAAAHFVGRKLTEIVTSRPRARAFLITKESGTVSERPLVVRYLGK